MSPEDRQKYCLKAYIMLACSLSGDFNEQPYYFRRILVTHLRANIIHMENMEMVDSYFDDAHEKFGRLLGEQGYNSEAEKFQNQVLHARSKTLGEEHPRTILAMSNLGVTYQGLRKYAHAEKLQIYVLDLRNRLLGEEHPDTISAMNNLAFTYERLGKYADGEKLQITVLALRNRLFGEENLDTIDAMNNLAITYGSLGKYEDAEKLQIQVLDRRNRLLGEEHPDTINAMSKYLLMIREGP